MTDGGDGGARAALVRLVRDEGRRVLATLIRHTGDLQLAEDAVQDAVLRALDTWPRTGVPPQPRAWLTVTARNRAVDLVRRESARTGKEAEAVNLVGPPADEPPEVLRDDQLRLVFTCCHPALAVETQVALALHTLCGLTTAEVGRALLVPEATMSKRLTRAKHKIARAAIPYRVPDVAELPDRLRGVTTTVYLLFNEGYPRPDGTTLVDEAVRLAQQASISIAGSGGVSAGNLEIASATVSVIGSGNVTAHATQTADISIMGSGDVILSGAAKCSIHKMGSGDVRCGG
jgi:RNA polymerase sigma-70 factor (ECF subfamily)